MIEEAKAAPTTEVADLPAVAGENRAGRLRPTLRLSPSYQRSSLGRAPLFRR